MERPNPKTATTKAIQDYVTAMTFRYCGTGSYELREFVAELVAERDYLIAKMDELLEITEGLLAPDESDQKPPS